jgi:hypothetical protein
MMMIVVVVVIIIIIIIDLIIKIIIKHAIKTVRASGTAPLRQKLSAMQAYSYHSPTLTSRL